MKRTIPFLITLIKQGSLVKQIIAGLVLGILVALAFPGFAQGCGVLGSFFVSALKAVAPVLVFVLVAASIANQESTTNTAMKDVIVLYLVGTFLAALVAVFASFLFPTQIALIDTKDALSAPGGIGEVVKNLIFNIVDNPVKAIANANYIGILAWAVGFGLALKKASNRTREILNDLSDGIEFIVHIVISCAPIGIYGLVSNTFATEGFGALVGYVQLLAVLLGCMFFVALVFNPILVWFCIRRNPYPLTLLTLRESGVMAFFTRSSAANIPVNLELCRKLQLSQDTYSVSIPLGATINMAGAAITITVLALSACTTLGVHVDFLTAVLLAVVASLCACGAAGVPGGSLMLIPLACSLFGIDNNTAMQVVAVGFIIGVLQDSCETALNSSSDALFTAAACFRAKRLESQK